jgi:multiple sugar transport system permease protein
VSGYVHLFQYAPVLRWLLNSTIVATIAVASHLALCSLAGYGFARLKFAGRSIGFFLMVATIMIPTQLLMIPTYIMFSKLGLVDTLAAAFVPWLASAFGIFLMRQFFLSLPVELEDAARIDGCSTFGVFRRIVLPLAKPALATLTIFTLLGSWNDLIWPLIAISDERWYTIQLGLANFQGVRRTEWSLLMSGNVVATMPLIVGMFLTSLIVGRIITKTGLWKRYLVGGSVALVLGLAILGSTRVGTSYLTLAAGMLLAGVGMGATMQNLVLAVQNSVTMRDIGSASATVSFLRSLGGAIGVSALGAVLATQVKHHVISGLHDLGVSPSGAGSSNAVPDPAMLPAPVAHVVENAYALGTSWVFIISAIAAAVGAVAIWFIREVPLRTTNVDEDGLHEDPLQIASETIAAAGGVAENPVFAELSRA